MSNWYDTEQQWLTEEQSLNNAQNIINYFMNSNQGWTPESLSALCGNMRHESSINPNMYEFGYSWGADRGYGLVQWTPRSKYWNWAISAGLDPKKAESQLARIDYEVVNNIQWWEARIDYYGANEKYRMSFKQFRENSKGLSVEELTRAFCLQYEAPADPWGSLPPREKFARKVLNTCDFDGLKLSQNPTPVENVESDTQGVIGIVENIARGVDEVITNMIDKLEIYLTRDIFDSGSNQQFSNKYLTIHKTMDNMYKVRPNITFYDELKKSINKLSDGSNGIPSIQQPKDNNNLKPVKPIGVINNSNVKRKNIDLFSQYTGTNHQKPKGIVIHNDAGNPTGLGYENWLRSDRANSLANAELGFAHEYISENEILQVQPLTLPAWACANTYYNNNYVSLEVCQQMSVDNVQWEKNEEFTIMRSAEICHQYNITPSRDTFNLHHYVSTTGTSCPLRSMQNHGGYEKVLDYFINRTKYYMSKGKTIEEMLGAETIEPILNPNNSLSYHVTETTSVKATQDGVIIETGDDYIIIEHKKDNYFSKYENLSIVGVIKGESVNKGAEIGKVNNELIFSVSESNDFIDNIDPLEYFETEFNGISDDIQKVVDWANSIKDNSVPYSMSGARDMVSSGDCSSFTYLAFKNGAGINIGYNTSMQYDYAVANNCVIHKGGGDVLEKIIRDAKTGDYVLMTTSTAFVTGGASHVGLMISDKIMRHQSSGGATAWIGPDNDNLDSYLRGMYNYGYNLLALCRPLK